MKILLSYKRIIVGFAFTAAQFACTPVAAPVAPTSPPLASSTPSFLTPIPAPRTFELGKSYFDVHYCNDGVLPLKMTVIVPAHPLREPAPILLHLKFSSDLIQPLLRRGFAVASIEWREPPNFKLPIGLMDVKCAVRYLHATAAQFNVDPEQIGVFGCSRGGHMAALVGVTDASAKLEGDFGFAEQSSRVQAVVMFDGIADFRTNYADAISELAEIHGIKSFDDPLVAGLSPITYASADDPPFLLIASEDEHWQNQAQMLADALTAQGVSATYLHAQGASHCQYSASGPHSLAEMVNIIAGFFDRTLQ